MPFESKVYNYNLPKESINQTPYTDPNLSKLLIAIILFLRTIF